MITAQIYSLPLLTRVEELGLPVLIHLGFRKRGDFRSICARFPKLRVISAHAGFPFYRDLWRYRNECPNLFVDLSSPYIDEALARAAVAAMGAERCFYGTDAPYGFEESDGSYDYAEIKGWVERMPVNSNERERILGAGFCGAGRSVAITAFPPRRSASPTRLSCPPR